MPLELLRYSRNQYLEVIWRGLFWITFSWKTAKEKMQIFSKHSDSGMTEIVKATETYCRNQQWWFFFFLNWLTLLFFVYACPVWFGQGMLGQTHLTVYVYKSVNYQWTRTPWVPLTFVHMGTQYQRVSFMASCCAQGQRSPANPVWHLPAQCWWMHYSTSNATGWLNQAPEVNILDS